MLARTGTRSGVVAVTSEFGPRVDPAPLFDLVTGFPPDDCVDLTVPMPLSLAIYATMLESTGHGAELAVLRKLQIELARETARDVQARIADLTGADATEAPETTGTTGTTPSARVRISHIIEQRVPGVNGLRPHIHAYVGATVRATGGAAPAAVDVERLTALGDSDLFPAYRDRLVAATAERLGLTWGKTAWSSCEVLGPRWLSERTEQARHDDVSCRGPWPQRQIVTGRQEP